MAYVILDAGHAEVTPGKRSPGGIFREWEFNNWMQYKIKPRLEAHGINTYLVNPTPESGSEVSLGTRCSRANSFASGKSNVLFVSLHSNAAGNCTSWMNARGVEVYTAVNSSSKSNQASQILCTEIFNTLHAIDGGFKNRGPKKSNFYVVRNTNSPAILIEYAFYDNKADLELLQNRRYDMVEATVKGLCKYFGIAYKPAGTAPSNPQPSPTPGNHQYPNGTYNKKFRVNSPDGVLSVRDARPVDGKLGNKIGEYKTGDIIIGRYCLNNWMGVDYNGKQGFVNASMLVDVANDLPSTAHPFKNGTYKVKGRVTADILNVRAGRPGSPKYDTIVDKLQHGEVVEVDYCLNGWFSIYDHAGAPNPGFISGEYIELVLN